MEFFQDYMTPQNHTYTIFCKALLEPPIPQPNLPPEDGREYFLLVAKCIWYDPDAPPVSRFRATHVVAWPDFYASAAAAISEAFSGMPWQLPEGMVDEFAPLINSYARGAVVEVADFIAGPAQRVLHIDLYVRGPRHDGEVSEELLYGSEDGDWVLEDFDGDGDGDGDEVGRAVRESADEFRTVPASGAAIEALEVVKIASTNTIGGRVRARARARAGKDCCDYKCAVCLEEMTLSVSTSPDHHDDRPAIVRLPCSHLYHKDCIVLWLEKSHLCPLCRYAMPTS